MWESDSPSGSTKARGILLNTVVGIVIALAGWLIVDAIMAVLYNPVDSSGTSVWGKWSSIITSDSSKLCLEQAGSTGYTLAQDTTPYVAAVPHTTAGGAFTFDTGIEAQVTHESSELAALLSCMYSKVSSAGVTGNISSISDSKITSASKTFAQCAAGGNGCAHARNSCHYGGTKCIGKSYAVDFNNKDTADQSTIWEAANNCGANYIGREDTHLHISVGASCGCN